MATFQCVFLDFYVDINIKQLPLKPTPACVSGICLYDEHSLTWFGADNDHLVSL